MLGVGKIRNFWADKRGNVAMIFALVMIPIIGIAGFAIDAQYAFSKKNKVQHAIDSATLAGARLLQSTQNQSKVRKHARAYFAAITGDDGNGMVCGELTVNFIAEEEIETEVDCYVPTSLSRILGHDKLDFHVESTATYGIGKLDVAFVFDISGSMNSYGRLGDLKTAAKDAAEILLPEPGASGEGDVRIAMTAYNAMIDAGPYFEEVTGLKPRRSYVATNNYRKRETYTETERVCNNVCVRGNRYFCWEWDYQCRWEDVEKERWVDAQETVTKTITSTCVWERGGDHAFDDTQPKQVSMGDLKSNVAEGTYDLRSSSANDEAFLAAAYAYWDDYNDTWRTSGTECLNVDPFELNDNSEKIENYIEALYASGGTAGHQGIAWGWYLISPEWSDVFDVKATPLSYDEPDSVKAMIIMTDGDFNREFFRAQGDSSDQAKDLCDSIKAKNVIVYTVAFQAPNRGKEVLEDCASGAEFYFEAENGEQLVTTYQAIATSISDLRIKS